MKVFLSGPITGVPDYVEKFSYIEKILKSKNFTVMNPSILPPEGWTHEEYMVITLAMQQVCDATFLLSNWKESAGCLEEVKQANEIHQPIFNSVENLIKFRERGTANEITIQQN